MDPIDNYQAALLVLLFPLLFTVNYCAFEKKALNTNHLDHCVLEKHI